jgi:hypothetical protein
LGYLSLQNGIESIPLNKLDETTSTIDLQALSSSGNVVEPSHNPIGNEIMMNSNDIISYAFSNGTFASVLKYPDADGNNIVDAIEGNFYRYFIQYFVRAGSFIGVNLTATMSNPVIVDNYRLNIVVTDSETNFPSQIIYNGPAGSGLQNQSSESVTNSDPKTVLYSSPCIGSPTIPPPGIYNISYKTKTLSFNLPDQSNIIKYQAICVPTITLNQDGTINKINWEYKLSDGSGNVDPRALISELTIEIDKTGFIRVYDSPKLTSKETEHILTNQEILWNNVTRIYMAYNDVFGNHIVVTWDKN